jgi:hypothetical protein
MATSTCENDNPKRKDGDWSVKGYLDGSSEERYFTLDHGTTVTITADIEEEIYA